MYLLTPCTTFLGVIVDNGGSYTTSFIIAGMSHVYDVIKYVIDKYSGRILNSKSNAYLSQSKLV